MTKEEISPNALLLTVCVAQFAMPFMMAGVNSILPPIGDTLQSSAFYLSLITTFYSLGLSVFQLPAGSMGDIWGRKRIFLLGMGIFSLCALLLSCTTNIYVFLFLRFVQGAGAAMFNASGLAILAAAAPSGMRGRFLGISGAVVYAGIACGPPLAGSIAGLLTWQCLFALTGGIGLTAWWLMHRVRTEWYQDRGHPLDVRGCVLYGFSMTALTFGSTLMQNTALWGWSLFVISIIMLGIYAFLELRTEYPLLDVRLLFIKPDFGFAALAAFVNYAASFGMLLFFSLYLQLVHGMGVIEAGLFLSLQFIIQAVTTPYVGTLTDRYGAERVSAIGISLCAVALYCAAYLDKDSSLWLLAGTQVILGLGFSAFAIPNTNVLLESVGPEYLGQAAGLTGAVRTTGGLVNMVIISTTFSVFLGTLPIGPETADLFLKSMRFDLILFSALNLMAVVCAVGTIMIRRMRRKQVTSRQDTKPPDQP